MQPDQQEHERGLSTGRLAHDAQGLAGMHRHARTIDCAHHAPCTAPDRTATVAEVLHESFGFEKRQRVHLKGFQMTAPSRAVGCSLA
jgi:hypothetical protein